MYRSSVIRQLSKIHLRENREPTHGLTVIIEASLVDMCMLLAIFAFIYVGKPMNSGNKDKGLDGSHKHKHLCAPKLLLS